MSHITAELAERHPDELGLCDDKQWLSRRELEHALNRATNAMRDLCLPSGRRVGGYARNSAENVLAYQGALHAGLSSVPISAHFTADEVAYILEDSGTDVLFVGPETAATGIEAAARAGTVRIVGWRCQKIAGVESWESWLEQASADRPPDDVRPAPLLHYTSGTTGRPKGTETPPPMFPREPSIRAYFDRLRAAYQELVAISRGTLSSQGRIHAAVLSLLAARSFEHLIDIITHELSHTLGCEMVTLCVEGDGHTLPRSIRAGLFVLRPGEIDVSGEDPSTVLDRMAREVRERRP